MKHDRHETNPFLKNMLIPVKDRQVKISVLGKDDNVLINQVTGEVSGTSVVSYKKVDGAQFVKLFASNIALTFGLSSSGLKTLGVLIWVVQNKAIAKDEITLDVFILHEFFKANNSTPASMKLSLTTFKRGLSELEKAQIIAKKLKKGDFFINPNFIFNGDRIAFTTLIERESYEKHTIKSR